MSNTAVEIADLGFGPLEKKPLQYANFRAVVNGTEVTKTIGTLPWPTRWAGASTE
jgi:hypothetical protein